MQESPAVTKPGARTKPPFRADHVGSLLRPHELLQARDDHAAGRITVQFHNEQGDIEFTPAALHVDGKLGVSETIFGDDFRFLQQTVTAAVPKLTIPSPSMVHYRGGRAAIPAPSTWSTSATSTRRSPTGPRVCR